MYWKKASSTFKKIQADKPNGCTELAKDLNDNYFKIAANLIGKNKPTNEKSKEDDYLIVKNKKTLIRKIKRNEKTGRYRAASLLWLKLFDIETCEDKRSKIAFRRELCIQKTLRSTSVFIDKSWIDPPRYHCVVTEVIYEEFN
ncbi:TPA: PerC family transcriptional regulator [Escherichia coli]|nr:PerC family transcriptional regulator [Escherichia coli]